MLTKLITFLDINHTIRGFLRPFIYNIQSENISKGNIFVSSYIYSTTLSENLQSNSVSKNNKLVNSEIYNIQ